MKVHLTPQALSICLAVGAIALVQPGPLCAASSEPEPSDKVLYWNGVANNCAKIDHRIATADDTPDSVGEQFGPTRTGRAMAIVHIAIFDAVNAIDRSYRSYLPTAAAPANTSMDAAIAQAGHDSVVALWPHQAAVVDQYLKQQLDQIPDGEAKTNGIAVGKTAARDILVARANDGSTLDARGNQPPYTYGLMPGEWRPDPNHPTATPLTPDWGKVKPFAISSSVEFRAPPPPPMNSREYTEAFNEVKSLGGDGMTTPTIRTPDQTIAGLFWGYDAQPGLCAPVRFYNQIAQVIALQQHNSVVENARLFALVNIAMGDAGIAVWDTKFYYSFWRPITGIREADQGTGLSGLGDGNPETLGDPNWQPVGAPADNGNGQNFTPPFPAYTSGHAGIGGALFQVLRRFYGRDNITFTIVSDEFNTLTTDQTGTIRPLVPRTYPSFSAAEEENGQSRIYLGIHWGFDKVTGIRQGNQIADRVFDRFLTVAEWPSLTLKHAK